jgi:peptide/nickel transport system permease protein
VIYILNRIGQGLVVIWAALTLAFFLMFVIGDPVLMRVGEDASAELVERYRRLMGLDRPLLVQYGSFLLSAIQGDFGNSYRHGAPVMPILLERLAAPPSSPSRRS